MPIGDPGGCNFIYTTEGLPRTVFAAIVPVKDVKSSLEFYSGLLHMNVLYANATEAAVSREGLRLILRRSEKYGIDTGIVLGVDDPYALHRRLVDEGVTFVMDPKRLPLGVCTSFRDFDGNVLYAMETGAELRPN